MTLSILPTPSVRVPGTVDNTLLTVSGTPPLAPFSVVAGGGVGVTFSNLQFLAYNAGVLAAADRGGTIYVFTSSTGALLHSWSISFGGANIGGVAVDPAGLVYVIETQQASNGFTGKVHQYSQAGVESGGNWPYALSFITDAGWGWQGTSTWFIVVPNRTGTTAQLITTTGTSGGTNAMAHDYMGAQAPGALLTTSTYEANPQYVRVWHGDGSAGLHFGSGPRFAQATNGHCFSLLSGAVSMGDGTIYVLDSDSDMVYRFSSTGQQTGSASTDAYGFAHSMTQYCPIASDGTTLWYASSDSGGLLVAVSRANLDTICSYPRTYDYRDHALGIGAGIITSAAVNYSASGSMPAASIYLDSWWSQEASLTARCQVRTAAQVHAQTADSWTTLGSPVTGGTTALAVPSGTGFYEVQAQLLIAGTPVSAEVAYVTVGPVGATFNYGALAASGTPQREVQLADELLGSAGMARLQLDWSVLLPAGPNGGANSLQTAAYDTLIANAATEAATRGIPFELQIFQGNNSGETALFAYAGWLSYITALVNHYKANVHYWEVWNEPDNSGQGDAATFTTTILIPTANAIHAADATAGVVGPSYGTVDVGRLTTVAANGGLAKLDVVSCHPYGQFNQTFEENGTPAQLDAWKAVLASNGAGAKPLWFTEWGGWLDGLSPNMLLEAAAYAHLMLWMKIKGVSRLYPYVFEGTGGLGQLQGLIGLRAFGDQANTFTAAAAVLLAAKAAFGARTYHDQPATNAPLTYAARFVGSDQLLAVWCDHCTMDLLITSTVSCTLTIWDAFGATRTQAIAAGAAYAFTAGTFPTYIQAPNSTTLGIVPAITFGTNLALAATASASSTNPNTNLAPLHDGVVDAGGTDSFPASWEWYQTPADTAPAATLTLATPATVGAVLVVSHTNGSTMCSLRNYTVSTQVGGVWTVQATIVNQYYDRARLVSFPQVANCQAVKVDVQAVNFGGYAGGMQPSFWKVLGNPAGNTDATNANEKFYGPAAVADIQIGTGSGGGSVADIIATIEGFDTNGVPIPIKVRWHDNADGTWSLAGYLVNPGGGGGGGGAITAAAGSYVAGALVDGAIVTQGTQADAAYAGTGSTTIIGALKGLYAAITGLLKTVGNVASLAADSGNPVKIGAVYNTTAPAPTNGQRVDLQTDTAANLKVYLATALAQATDSVDTVHYGTPNAGASVSVATASTSVLAANANRKGLILTNTGANVITVDLSGGTAVALKGVVLTANGVPLVLDRYVPTGAITAIATTAATVLAVQELV